MIQSIIAFAATQFGIVLILMLIDLATGVWKSFKMRSELSSFRLRSSVNKLVLYFFVLCIGACLNVAGETAVAQLFTIFICLIEGLSILENLTKIFPNSDIIKKLTKLLHTEIDKKTR